MSKRVGLVGAVAVLVVGIVLLALIVGAPTSDRPEAPTAGRTHPTPVSVAPAAWVRTKPVTLSRHGFAPAIVVDSHGVATAVWQGAGTQSPVLSARLVPGGTWSAPVTIGHGSFPRAVVDAAGTVTVIVSTHGAGYTTGLAAVRRTSGGSWGQPMALTADRQLAGCDETERDVVCGAVLVDVAANERGDVAVAWSWGVNSGDGITPFTAQLAILTHGRGWVSPIVLAEQPYPQPVEVGLSGRGRATVVFDQGTSIVSRRVGPGGAVAEPASVWTLRDFEGVGLAVASDGTAVELVERFGDRGSTIVAVRRQPDGSWGAPHQLAEERREDSAWVVATGPGSVTAFWTTGASGVSAARWHRGSWSHSRVVVARDVGDWLLPVPNRMRDVALVWRGPTWTLRARVLAAGQWSPVVTLWRLQPEMTPDFEAALSPDGRLLTIVERYGTVQARWVGPS